MYSYPILGIIVHAVVKFILCLMALYDSTTAIVHLFPNWTHVYM